MSTLAQRIKQQNPWLTKIPQGSHGSGAIQKRYWKVTSDFVRIRDLYEWGSRCISCYVVKPYDQMQAGHCKSWASCRGYSKWDVLNIFSQCPQCNSFGDALTGEYFLKEIERRYGKDRTKYIKNLDSYPTEKLEDHVIVEKIKERLREMALLPVQPDYYHKIIEMI